MAFSNPSILNLDPQSLGPAGASKEPLPGPAEDEVRKASPWPTMFATDSEREQIAANLALSGSTLEEAEEYIEKFYEIKKTRLEKAWATRIGDIDQRVANAELDLKQIGRSETEAQEKLDELRKERSNLEDNLPLLRLQKQDAWQQILHLRVERGRQFFKDHETHLENLIRDRRKEILDEIDAQIEVDQKIYNIQKQNRAINDVEFNRRIEVCKTEKEKIETQLEKAQEYAEKLKTIGITRTSATFLFVAGFISIGGVGSVISSLLQGRDPGTDVLFQIIANLDKILNALVPARFAALAPAFKPFLFILLLLLFLIFFYVLVRVVDWLVQRFDAAWKPNSNAQEERESIKPVNDNKTLQEQFAGFTTSALSIKSQLSAFISLDLDRRDYTKLVASFPYIFLGGLLVFLLSGTDPNGKVVSLTTAYVGVIFALLATSVSLLYVTKIIEPRWAHAASENTSQKPDGNNEEAKKTRAVIRHARLNRELTGLFLLMVLSLLIAAFMPTYNQRWNYFNAFQMKLIVWGVLALFMSLSSLGLAYGIIQRGIFRDLDVLIRRRNEYRSFIEKFSMQPVIGGGGYGRTYGSELRVSNYFDLLHSLEEQRLWYEINEVFSDDFEFNETEPDDKSLRSLWFTLRRPEAKKEKPFLGLRLKHISTMEPRLIDFSVAPEETKLFLKTREEIARKETRVREIDTAATDVTHQIDRLQTDLKNQRQTHATYQEQKHREIETCESQISELLLARQKDLLMFRGNFAIGMVARNLLKDEGLLPTDVRTPVVG